MENLKKCFAWAIKRDMLKFEEENMWLSVYYKENMGYTQEDGTKWSLVCAQSIADYMKKDELGKPIEGTLRELELCNRITLMLVESLRSTKQDLNGYMKEIK